MPQGKEVHGIPGRARTRTGLDLVDRSGGKIVRTERLDTWRAVSAQAHLGRHEGSGDRVPLDKLDPGWKDLRGRRICRPLGISA